MKNIIELIFPFLFVETVGVLFFLAGFYGWSYPKVLRFESVEDSQKLWVQFLKIVSGIIFVVAGIGALIYRLCR
ncbi:MAG: hypothetical protein IJO83_01265 [Clostridia bacterium]|nr:hypothetical protein [Clostridia bacterium]